MAQHSPVASKKEFVINDSANDLIRSAKALDAKKLDLCRREIYEVPTVLLDLTKLEFLYLEGNLLQTLPEMFFSCLTNLKWLDLRRCNLVDLPQSIGESRSLRSLLLDDNKLKALPAELGLVSTLSGLHVAGNPIEFPPSNIIEQGTQVILAFLRKNLSQRTREELDADIGEDIDREEASTLRGVHDAVIALHPLMLQKRQHSDECSIVLRSGGNREEISGFSVVSSLLVSTPNRIASRRCSVEKRRADLDKCLSNDKKIATPMHPTKQQKSGGKRHSKQKRNSLPKPDRIEKKIQTEMKMSEHRMNNDKINDAIQKQKNKQTLQDWRKETHRIQKEKHFVAARTGIPKEPLEPPFGTEVNAADSATKHGQQVKSALSSLSKSSLLQMTRDREVIDKIDEHVQKLRNNRASRDKLTPAEQIEEAKRNLEEALQLQRQLQEKKALEYRLRAFTAEDYAPPSHSFPKGAK